MNLEQVVSTSEVYTYLDLVSVTIIFNVRETYPLLLGFARKFATEAEDQNTQLN